MSVSEEPRQGLFAFVGQDFHFHIQDTPDLDHVAWFESIGLPSHGPAFDVILRGKATIDIDADLHIIAFYGAAFLSNHRYRVVVEAFRLDENRVKEKRLSEPY